jgi:uncharacterized membrane protein
METRLSTMERLGHAGLADPMTSSAALVLGAAAIGSGVVAGVFGAFSGFVMPALDRLAGDGGAAAMRSINVTAVRPPLMIAMFGTAAVSVAAAVVAPGASTLLGAASYLAGVVGVTVAANVPLNDRLAAGQLDWSSYRRPWTRWNSVRTAAAVASAAAFTAAVAG